MTNDALTYAQSGVDTEAGDRAVELMKAAVSKTHNSSVLGGVGGFAGLIDVSALREYERPLLASSTDGVGTKVAIAQAIDKHDTIGIDLVAMVVDDIVVCGAKPLLMTDYIACGKVFPERIADIVRGIARGCELARTPLVGGETAEHPGLLGEHEYDVAGAAVGVVEAADALGPDKVCDGDVIVAMEASGVHSNGYSMVRAIAAKAGWSWNHTVDEFGCTAGEELLTPTAVYTGICLDVAPKVHAFTHITGGGIEANVARVIPAGMHATVDRASWRPLRIFDVLAAAGSVERSAMEATFNMGMGMAAICAPGYAAAVISACEAAGFNAWTCGTVEAVKETPEGAISGTKGVQAGSALLVGDYAS